MYSRYHPYKLLFMATDVVITVLLLAALTRLEASVPGHAENLSDIAEGWLFYVFVGLLWHAIFATTGVYEIRRISSFTSQVGPLAYAHILAVLMFTGALYFLHKEMSRHLLACFAVANYVLLLFPRMGVHLYLKGKRPVHGEGSVLIVGISESGMYLAQTIIDRHASVLKIVGFADDDAPSDRILPAPLVGGLSDVPRIVQERDISSVVIAFPETRSGQVESVIYSLEKLPVRIYVVPDVLTTALVNADVETFGDLAVIGLREPVIQGHQWVLKRLLDLTLSILALLVTWPLYLAIWVAVRIDSPGPGIFVSKRVGQNGRIFNVYKFRTMFTGSEDIQVEAAKDPTLTKEQACAVVYKTRDDPRITRVGRWLRKTSLDELPQIFNVLKGEMSLVGPRPEQLFLTECYDHWQRQRLLVPPGVTGWWQISGRSDYPMHLNTQYDVYYVRNYSVWLDIKILFKTIGAVLRGKGAY
jgi:exopolysaccharide biosynthesis polyprenyl glycosylphosphotransferase